MKTVNAARCKKCGDIIQSRYRHDYVACSCGSISVDGGLEYCRYGFPGGNPDDWIEVIKTEEELIDLLQKTSANWTYVSKKTLDEYTQEWTDEQRKTTQRLRKLIKDVWGEEV